MGLRPFDPGRLGGRAGRAASWRRSGKADVLFWVGCAGAYDARYRKVARAFATLLKKAGVDFAILGTEEKCTGDPARRMGNEYLAQSLITENIATLNRYGVKKIVVTCPHCLQSLGKEYRQFGGTYEVVHHSTFLRELIEKGVLRLNARQRGADHVPRSVLPRAVQRRV